MEHVKSNFSTLIKALSIPVPIFTSITIAIAIGYDQIPILSFSLPVNFTAFFSIVILLFIYLQCYRSARVIHRELLNSYRNGENEYDQNVSFLKTRSSIFNPFLNSEPRGEKGAFSDYLGIIVNNIPPVLISLIFNILFFFKAMDAVYKQYNEILESGQLSLPWGLISIHVLFIVVSFPFEIIYLMFLFKISEIMAIVNSEDDWTRILLMFGIPVSFFVISFFIQIAKGLEGWIIAYKIFQNWI